MAHIIHTASRAGNLNAVKNALASGVNPSVQDDQGWTPLHYAAFSSHLDVVRELLAAGADFTIQNHEGCLPFEVMDISVVYENDIDENDFNQIETLLTPQEEIIKEPEFD